VFQLSVASPKHYISTRTSIFPRFSSSPPPRAKTFHLTQVEKTSRRANTAALRGPVGCDVLVLSTVCMCPRCEVCAAHRLAFRSRPPSWQKWMMEMVGVPTKWLWKINDWELQSCTGTDRRKTVGAFSNEEQTDAKTEAKANLQSLTELQTSPTLLHLYSLISRSLTRIHFGSLDLSTFHKAT
jgi:hypothetical protein